MAGGSMIRFGPFELDRNRGDLRKHGVRVRIQDQPLRVLTMLLDNAGEVVSREELVRALWPSGGFTDVEQGLNAAVNRLRQVLGDSPRAPRYVQTVARRGYCFTAAILEPQSTALAREGAAVPVVEQLGLSAPAPRRPLHSIAVLPFQDFISGEDSEYFGEGLAEELIRALTKVPALRVIARTSTSPFRSSETPLNTITRALSVDLVLTGTARRHRERIRVTAQLINAADAVCLWSEAYDRRIVDLLDVQEDIARAIANTLKLTLQGGDLVRRYTEREDAYLLYLKGQFHTREWTPEGIERIRMYMRQVVTIEPGYAPAWVELAHASFGRTMLGTPARQAIPEGMEAAQRALSADPVLAEAHGVLGFLVGLYAFDWRQAFSAFERAQQLNPASPSIHFWHALVLNAVGRVQDATTELHRSLDADPLSVLSNMHLCRQYTVSREYDEAIRCGERAVQAGPQCFPALARLGEARYFAGQAGAGIELMEKARSLAPTAGWYTATLADAYRRCGQQDKANAILQETEQMRTERYVPSAVLAFTAAAAGKVDLAFSYFDRALIDRDAILQFVKTERSLDRIRQDSRYLQLLSSLGIPGEDVTH